MSATRPGRRSAPSLVLLPLLLLGLPGGDPSNRCGVDELCLFEDNNMRGSLVAFDADDASYADDAWDTPHGSEPTGPDDATSAIVNDTDRWAVVYVDRQQRGHALCVGPGAFVEDLEAYDYDAYGHTFGDAASSHELRSTRPRPLRRGGPCDHVVTRDDVVGGGGWDPAPVAPATQPGC